MRKILVIALFVVTTQTMKAQAVQSVEYHNDAIESSTEYKEGNPLQKDFLLFVDMLETTHPAFSADVQSPFDIDSIRVNGYRRLAACSSPSILNNCLQKITSLLNDGHTGMLGSQDNLVYPVSYFNDGGNYYITAIAKAEKDNLGKKIIAVNGMPVGDVIKDICAEVSAENDAGRQREVRNQAFRAWKYWENKPYVREDSLLVLKVENGKDIVLHLTRNFFNDVATLPQTPNNGGQSIRVGGDVPFASKIDSDGNVAYLQFNKCEDQFFTRWIARQQGITLTKEQEEYVSRMPSFHEFLRDFFDNVERHKIGNLVIDMRDNFGGNSILCSELLSWLADIGKSWLAPTPYMRPSRLYTEYYKNQYKDTYAKIVAQNSVVDGNHLYNASTGRMFSVSDDSDRETLDSFPEDLRMLFNTDTTRLYRGNVIFIQNDNTFSSAADMILMAHDNHIGRVIGGHSSYLTSNYGDLIVYSLPNTHVVGYVSHKYFSRPDKTRIEEKEIVPNPVIERSWADRVSGNDPCWVWIKANL